MKRTDLLREALNDELEAMRPELDDRRRMLDEVAFRVRFDQSGGIRSIVIDQSRRGRYQRGGLTPAGPDRILKA